MKIHRGHFITCCSIVACLSASVLAQPTASPTPPPSPLSPASSAPVATANVGGDVEDLGGEEPDTPPPGTPSPTYQKAKKFLDQDSWAQAAVAFHEVIQNKTDDVGNTQHAKYWLAVALHHLEYYQASYNHFHEIAKSPKHLDFEKTLGWLARLATQLPEPADIISHLGKYSDAQIVATAKGSADLLSQLNYLYGRYKYRRGDYAKATKLLTSVSSESRYFVPAQFFLGITSVRQRKINPAVKAFERILEHLERNPKSVDDPQRYRDLAHLSMARAYYSAAIKQKDKDKEEGVFVPDPDRLTSAVLAWNKVDVASEYWLDALFEESWAYFMASDYPKALGNIHTIQSPFFPNAFYPEVDFLKAIIYFTNCQYDNAKVIVGKFVKKYEPVKKGLEDILDRRCPGPKPDAETGQLGELSLNDAKQCLSFLTEVRENRAKELQGESNRILKSVADGAFDDREVLRHLEYLKVIRMEQDRLKQAQAPIKNSAVSIELSQSLEKAYNEAALKTGTLARGRFVRSVDELNEHLSNVKTIIIDILASERGQLEKLGEAKAKRIKEQQTSLRGLGDVKADEEHYVWPFEGEYWRDELGFYRQKVVNSCGGRN